MASQSLIAWIVVGLVAGAFGGWILGGGWVRYMIAGMLGALVAGWGVDALALPIPIHDFWFRQITVALVGAIIVILAARTLS
ncbi:MAG: GlsB/YeaQ/YmgE family stress response membrane protein [Cucumibacter sp.]